MKCYEKPSLSPKGGDEKIIIAMSLTKGKKSKGLNIQLAEPVIYGLLTTNDLQQAKDRAGGKFGNKGDECAVVAIKMAKF